MKEKSLKTRTIVLFSILLVIIFVYCMRLLMLQIVNGDYYQQLSEQGTVRKQTIKAVRGEIVDRNGVPIVVNEVGYDVIVDAAYLPSDPTGSEEDSDEPTRNDVLLELVHLLQNQGEEWLDTLPITTEAPFEFTGDASGESKLKSLLGVGEYATCEDVFHWLIERYHLEEYSEEDARILAGIRYGMETKDFSVTYPYTVAEQISDETVIKLEENSFRLPGVRVEQSTSRKYTMPDIAEHIIGEVGPIYAEEYAELKDKGYGMNDEVGKSGLELAMEDYLRGTDGTRILTFDQDGNVIDSEIETEAIPGNTVQLTLDIGLQKVAETSLEEEIKHLQDILEPGKGGDVNAGAAVVISCKTGEVLAAASAPGYNMDTYHELYDELLNTDGSPLFPRATQGSYMPGSIFKPIVASAALQEGIITRDSTFYCDKYYTYYSGYTPSCLGRHGNINVINALRNSCNVYFFEASRLLGIDKLNEYAEMFGCNLPTGVEIPESTGQLTSVETSEKYGQDWFDGNVIQAGIGQKDTKISPLQMANYTATIANRGTRYKLHFVKSLMNYTADETVQEFSPEVAMQVPVSEENFEIVIDGMESVITATNQSIKYFGNYPISLAAKTGSPQANGIYLPGNGTYIIFGPVEDPEIAVAIVLENAVEGIYAIPIARDIFDYYFFSTDQNTSSSSSESGSSSAEGAQSNAENSSSSSSEASSQN